MKLPKLAGSLTAPVLVASLTLSSGIAVADHGTDSASGKVNGHVDIFNVTFSARSTNVGTDVRGHIRATRTDLDPNQVFVGEVTCLMVTGATLTGTPASAAIFARITDQPPGSAFLSIAVLVTDSGKFSNAPDLFGLALLASPSPPEGSCGGAGGSPVADGEVTIHNTLP
jgi:hypothetical protein